MAFLFSVSMVVSLLFYFPHFSSSCGLSQMARAFPYVSVVNLISDEDDLFSPRLSAEEREKMAGIFLPEPLALGVTFAPLVSCKCSSFFKSATSLKAATDHLALTNGGFDNQLDLMLPSHDERRSDCSSRHFVFFYTFMFSDMG